MLQYFFYRIAQFIVCSLPRPAAYRFSQCLSDLQFTFSTKDRNAVINNLHQILGPHVDVSQKAREVFRKFGRYLVDFFLMYRIDQDFVANNVRIQGAEFLEQAVAKGNGVIILTAHLGNWELGAAILKQFGYKLTAIALPHKVKAVNDLFNQQRERQGAVIVPTSVAVRRCVEALRNSEFVALLGDRVFGDNGEPLMFLGRETLIPKGAAFFAAKTGATILPAFLFPEADGKYTFHLSEPIDPPQGRGRDKEEILRVMVAYAAVIEKIIRRDPTQWLMFREFGIEKEYLYTHTSV